MSKKSYFGLDGQVAIVTGASGGLGVQMAKALANQGAKIVVMARRQEKIDAVLSCIQANPDCNATDITAKTPA